jgi:hypothetical protein
MSSHYAALAAEHDRPKRIVDHRHAWERLTPLPGIDDSVRGHVAAFAEQKQISLTALEALGTRVKVDRHGGVELAWAYRAPASGAVTAVKFRPIGDKTRYTLAPSTYLGPLIVGRRDSLDWFVAEGESDGARLFDLIGDVAAVVVAPAGALTFKREWANSIPRGATVHLCHDADDAGDQGADKAARMVGGRTVRVRPPIEGGDWCDWKGSRDDFIALVSNARSTGGTSEFSTYEIFVTHTFPMAEPLLGEPGAVYLAVGTLLLVYGAEGTGKTTLTVDAVAHLAAGRAWLGIPVPRPVRILLIENEGPPSLFQRKLADKAATWDGPDFTGNLFIYKAPWGEFSFADADKRAASQTTATSTKSSWWQQTRRSV